MDLRVADKIEGIHIKCDITMMLQRNLPDDRYSTAMKRSKKIKKKIL